MSTRLRKRLSVAAVVLLLVLALSGASPAAEIALTVEWTEPTYANDPAYLYSQLRFTRIRWSPVACLDQPPPGVREEQRGQWTHCGFGWLWADPSTGQGTWKIDVPANTPAGGERRTATLTIPNANLAWPAIMLVFDFFVADGKQCFMIDQQEATLTRTPTGELTKPPTVLGVTQP